jgi:hypothetical protein
MITGYTGTKRFNRLRGTGLIKVFSLDICHTKINMAEISRLVQTVLHNPGLSSWHIAVLKNFSFSHNSLLLQLNIHLLLISKSDRSIYVQIN